MTINPEDRGALLRLLAEAQCTTLEEIEATFARAADPSLELDLLVARSLRALRDVSIDREAFARIRRPAED